MKEQNTTPISYEKKLVTDFRGVTRETYNAKVGSTKYQCFSLDQLENCIKNHVERNDFKAAEAFYNN